MANHIVDVRSALDITGWRTTDALNRMGSEDKRNTLIVELNKHSNLSIQQLQGKSNQSLAGMTAVFQYLYSHKFRHLSQLQQMSDEDQRNTLIVELDKISDIGIRNLQGKDNFSLVKLGEEFYKRDKTITEVYEVHWDVDKIKIINQTPEMLAEQKYDNRQSDQVLTDTFSYEKTIEKETNFETEASFDMSMKTEVSFKAGVPMIAEVSGKLTFQLGTSKTWTHGGRDKVSQTFEKTIEVNVKPRAAMIRKSSVTVAKMDVPYRMDVKTETGRKTTISGVWHGVSMYNVQDIQIDL